MLSQNFTRLNPGSQNPGAQRFTTSQPPRPPALLRGDNNQANISRALPPPPPPPPQQGVQARPNLRPVSVAKPQQQGVQVRPPLPPRPVSAQQQGVQSGVLKPLPQRPDLVQNQQQVQAPIGIKNKPQRAVPIPPPLSNDENEEMYVPAPGHMNKGDTGVGIYTGDVGVRVPPPLQSTQITQSIPQELQNIDFFDKKTPDEVKAIEAKKERAGIEHAPKLINDCANEIMKVFKELHEIKNQNLTTFSKHALHKARYDHLSFQNIDSEWDFYQIYRYVQDGISDMALQLLNKMQAYNNNESGVGTAMSEVAAQCGATMRALYPFLAKLKTKDARVKAKLFSRRKSYQ